MTEFHGLQTKQVAGMPGLSRTFATEVMCHPLLLALCDRVLLPSCSRYQLNLGHLLQRGPGAEEQWLHRDELVWSDVPWPHPQLQVASVIAFVDFTRDNGATRIVPGSHRWPDRGLPALEQMQEPVPPEQLAYAEMPAGFGRGVPRRNDSRGRREQHRRARAAARISATAWAGCAPRRTTTYRSRRRM